MIVMVPGEEDGIVGDDGPAQSWRAELVAGFSQFVFANYERYMIQQRSLYPPAGRNMFLLQAANPPAKC